MDKLVSDLIKDKVIQKSKVDQTYWVSMTLMQLWILLGWCHYMFLLKTY